MYCQLFYECHWINWPGYWTPGRDSAKTTGRDSVSKCSGSPDRNSEHSCRDSEYRNSAGPGKGPGGPIGCQCECIRDKTKLLLI